MRRVADAPLPSGMPTTGTTSLSHLLSRRAAETTSLDGTWKAIPDPYDVGGFSILGPAKDGWFRDASLSIRLNASNTTSTGRSIWRCPATGTPRFPSCTTTRPRSGTADASPRPRRIGRTFVHFGAVNHSCTIYLDGDVLASHEGGYGPFAVEVTGRIGVGEHSLVVLVDCIRKPDRVPAMRTDWFNFGGLHRSVDLVRVPSTFISSVAHHGRRRLARR